MKIRITADHFMYVGGILVAKGDVLDLEVDKAIKEQLVANGQAEYYELPKTQGKNNEDQG